MSRIVVVDDHPVFRKGLSALLRAEGHHVVAEASDGVEAVAVVAAELPDVVLMDLSMPLRDGFEATAYITAAHPDTKVLVITLFDDEASVVRALAAGASGYVSKQADPDQVTAHIANGELTIRLEKAAKAKPRRIKLTSGGIAAKVKGLLGGDKDKQQAA